MSFPLLTCAGGVVEVPSKGGVLVPREDGGHLIVNPPRPVWERSELSSGELSAWAMLVAATGKAMIDSLPQLHDGCVNYWEAGNWSLNVLAEPEGDKDPRVHRRVHLHVLGRSRNARHPAWRWGEAPVFPAFAERVEWARSFDPLTADECNRVLTHLTVILRERYGLSSERA